MNLRLPTTSARTVPMSTVHRHCSRELLLCGFRQPVFSAMRYFRFIGILALCCTTAKTGAREGGLGMLALVALVAPWVLDWCSGCWVDRVQCRQHPF